MFHNFLHFYAGVLELADEADSKSAACEGVWVRVPPPAPKTKEWIDTIGISPFSFAKRANFPFCKNAKLPSKPAERRFSTLFRSFHYNI